MFFDEVILNIVILLVFINMNNYGQMDCRNNYSDCVCFYFIENFQEQVWENVDEFEIYGGLLERDLFFFGDVFYFLESGFFYVLGVVNINIYFIGML